MARARNIKPGFFRNADLVELPMEARLLFIGLWTLADRAGRLEDRPKQIKMEVFPADSVDVDACLNALAATGMVARYEIDGKRYLQVANFHKHQNPHRDEKASTIPDQGGHVASNEPAPCKHRASTVQAPCNNDGSTVAIGLTPESLIPDSLNLDSLTELPPAQRDRPSAGGGQEFFKDDQPDPESAPRFTPTDAARMMMAMKAEGISDGTPSNPKFMELVKAGASAGELMDAAKKAVAAGKGFNYAVAIAIRERNDAAALALTMPKGPLLAARATAANETFAERDARKGRERWEEMTGRIHPDNIRSPPAATEFVEDITPIFLENTQ